jgi:hypothetical protein
MSPIKPWSNDVFPDPTDGHELSTWYPKVDVRQLEQRLFFFDLFRFGYRYELGIGFTMIILFPRSSLPSSRTRGGQSQVSKRCVVNFDGVLQFRILHERLRNYLRSKAPLETTNRILCVCNRTQRPSYNVTGSELGKDSSDGCLRSIIRGIRSSWNQVNEENITTGVS